jgi:hypothetical protein
MDDAASDDQEETLDIPFTFAAVDVALARKYCFEMWAEVVACASFLGIVFPESVVMVSKLVTLEIVRASGINPFHVHEASLFTAMLAKHDPRLMHIEPLDVEGLYWMVVRSNTNLERDIREHLGNEMYEATVAEARELREQHTKHHPHQHMTSLGTV